MRLLPIIAALCAAPLLALDVSGLEPEAHIAGPTLREKDLKGKVVAVEDWGVNCPICKNSLPQMGKLAKSLAKDSRVVFVGSHVQRRDDATARALLEKAGCDYPVYQGFRVAGAPTSSAIPFAYVVDHRGEVVWSGNPASEHKAFAKAIADAAKAVPTPIPGSLLDGMEVRFAKDMPRRLVIGRNVEGALQQLRARARRGGEAGAEAEAIVARCEAWADETEAAIREALPTRPSKALALGRDYLRTFPTRAASLKAEFAALAKDPALQPLLLSRQTLARLRATPAKTANARKAALARAQMQLRRLDGLAAQGAPEADLADLRAEWQALIAELGAE